MPEDTKAKSVKDARRESKSNVTFNKYRSGTRMRRFDEKCHDDDDDDDDDARGACTARPRLLRCCCPLHAETLRPL